MRLSRSLLLCAAALLPLLAGAQAIAQEDLLRTTSEPGISGGKLVIAQRSEPRTLNPIQSVDQNSLGVLGRMMGDLIHINRATQKTEPALAKSWTVSKDGTVFTLKLRRGIRFSDGQPFDADDVLFTFKVYLDEQVHSIERDLLVISGKRVNVEKLDAYTVRFTFPSPYSAAERVFDGLAILPRHLLEKDYQAGKIGQDWTLNTPPAQIAGLGAFRLKQVVPGERIVLERNPYYWKVDAKGQKLPYLDELTFVVVPTQDAQVIRFQAGDSQIISGLSADNYAALETEQKARNFKLYDAGPGLEYNFLMFNLNSDTENRLPEVARKQKWFRDVRFRQAVSAAIDRAEHRAAGISQSSRGAGHACKSGQQGVVQFLHSCSGTLFASCPGTSESRRIFLEARQYIGGFQRATGGVHHPGKLQQHATRADCHTRPK